MTTLANTTFVGTALDKIGVGEPGIASQMSTVAADQGMAWEIGTGYGAESISGGGITTANDAHNHSESGNRIWRSLMQQSWGMQGPNLAPWDNTLVIKNDGYRIQTTSSTTVTDNALIAATLLEVPRGFEDTDILVIVDCDGDPRLDMTLLDSSVAVVAGYEKVPLVANGTGDNVRMMLLEAGYGDRAMWCAVFQVATAGIYVLKFLSSLKAENETRIIRSINVLATPDVARRTPLVDAPPANSSNTVQVGDANGVTVGWIPIDTNFVADHSPLHSALCTILANNNALLYELLTGLPAPGNATLTVTRGHNHTGETASGVTGGTTIHMPHWTKAFGGDLQTGVGVPITGVTGAFSTAPNAADTSTSLQQIANARVYMPANTLTGAATSELKCAVLVAVDSSKSNTFEVEVAFGSTTRQFRSSGSGGINLEILTTPVSGANKFEYTADAVNTLTVKIRYSTYANPGHARCYSVMFYV